MRIAVCYILENDNNAWNDHFLLKSPWYSTLISVGFPLLKHFFRYVRICAVWSYHRDDFLVLEIKCHSELGLVDIVADFIFFSNLLWYVKTNPVCRDKNLDINTVS